MLCYVLTLKSVNEILRCDHSNETSLAVFLHGTINLLFNILQNKNWGFLLNFMFQDPCACDQSTYPMS